MARNCGCAGASCGCLIQGVQGITITGIGTAEDPYRVAAELNALNQAISFQNSSTITFDVTGTGSITDPMTVSATALARPFPAYTTGGRPSAAASGVGAFYYDTTTEQPMWSDGVVWQAAYVQPELHPKPLGFLSAEIRGTSTSGTGGAGVTVYGIPIFITKPTTIDAMHMRVTTLEAATSAKLLLYSSDVDGHPTDLVAMTTIDCSTTGYKTGTIGAPLTLQPGLYWAQLRSNSPGNLMRYTTVTPQGLPGVSDGTAGPYTSMTITTTSGSYASPPNPIVSWSYADALSTNAAWIALRRSA